MENLGPFGSAGTSASTGPSSSTGPSLSTEPLPRTVASACTGPSSTLFDSICSRFHTRNQEIEREMAEEATSSTEAAHLKVKFQDLLKQKCQEFTLDLAKTMLSHMDEQLKANSGHRHIPVIKIEDEVPPLEQEQPLLSDESSQESEQPEDLSLPRTTSQPSTTSPEMAVQLSQQQDPALTNAQVPPLLPHDVIQSDPVSKLIICGDSVEDNKQDLAVHQQELHDIRQPAKLENRFPAQPLPVQEPVQMQQLPAQPISVRKHPEQFILVRKTPAKSLLVRQTTGQSLLARQLPAQSILVRHIPEQPLPVQEIPAQPIPVQPIPAGYDNVRAQSLSAQQLPGHSLQVQHPPVLPLSVPQLPEQSPQVQAYQLRPRQLPASSIPPTDTPVDVFHCRASEFSRARRARSASSDSSDPPECHYKGSVNRQNARKHIRTRHFGNQSLRHVSHDEVSGFLVVKSVSGVPPPPTYRCTYAPTECQYRCPNKDAIYTHLRVDHRVHTEKRKKVAKPANLKWAQWYEKE